MNPPSPSPEGRPSCQRGRQPPGRTPRGSRWCRQSQRRSQLPHPRAAVLGRRQAGTAGRWRTEVWTRWPHGAQRRLAWSPNPTTPLRRRRKSPQLHPVWPPALPWLTRSPHPSPCTPGMASPRPAAQRQRSARPPEHPVRPPSLSTPPACHTRSHPQPPRRQPSAWRACRPRAPASPPVGSF